MWLSVRVLQPSTDDASCLIIGELIIRSSEDIHLLSSPFVQMAKAGFALEKITANPDPRTCLR